MIFLVVTAILGFCFLIVIGVVTLIAIDDGEKPNPFFKKILIWSLVAILSSTAIMSFIPVKTQQCVIFHAEVQTPQE